MSTEKTAELPLIGGAEPQHSLLVRQILRGMGLVGSMRDHLRARWYLRSARKLGKRVRVNGRLWVQNYGQLLVGQRVQFVATLTPIELFVGSQGALEIGDHVFMNYGCSIAAMHRVKIGPRCNIGPYVNIMDNSFHRLEPERRNERPASAPVILEENVWLGARVIVLPGVVIGSGSVIGAGSVVTNHIPARSLAVGVPARVIRPL